jgi:hypothetical protein
MRQNILGGPEPGHEELRYRGAGGLGAAPPGEQRRHPAQGGGHHSRPQAQVVAGGARGRRLPGRVSHEKNNNKKLNLCFAKFRSQNVRNYSEFCAVILSFTRISKKDGCTV